METKPLPFNQSFIKSCLNYNEETGLLYYKNPYFSSDIGRAIGGKDEKGYIRIRINYIKYKAHRIIWLWYYGEDPHNKEIDHINGIRDDNRIVNLRLATDRLTAQNNIRTRSGKLVGTSWDKRENKWHAQIKLRGYQYSRGYYNTEEEAHKAYLEALHKFEIMGVIT
jgi:hypothetical protein